MNSHDQKNVNLGQGNGRLKAGDEQGEKIPVQKKSPTEDNISSLFGLATLIFMATHYTYRTLTGASTSTEQFNSRLWLSLIITALVTATIFFVGRRLVKARIFEKVGDIYTLIVVTLFIWMGIYIYQASGIGIENTEQFRSGPSLWLSLIITVLITIAVFFIGRSRVFKAGQRIAKTRVFKKCWGTNLEKQNNMNLNDVNSDDVNSDKRPSNQEAGEENGKKSATNTKDESSEGCTFFDLALVAIVMFLITHQITYQFSDWGRIGILGYGLWFSLIVTFVIITAIILMGRLSKTFACTMDKALSPQNQKNINLSQRWADYMLAVVFWVVVVALAFMGMAVLGV